jgi:myosin heavy subunit
MLLCYGNICAHSKLVAGVNTATVGTQFKSQLEQLMSTLKRTSPHFIRCIKPNAIKVTTLFVISLILCPLFHLAMLMRVA